MHGYGYDRRLRLLDTLNALDHRLRSSAARLFRRDLRPPPLPPARTGEPPELRDYERARLEAWDEIAGEKMKAPAPVLEVLPAPAGTPNHAH